MILRLPSRSRIRNLNTLQAIVHRALPALQLKPSIRAIREKQRILREALHSLRVKVLGGREVAVLESLVALLFESVGGGGHRTRPLLRSRKGRPSENQDCSFSEAK
jgi:hypothetical protein